jgi:hypothetical protein
MKKPTKSIPYFTRNLLIEASRLGLERDYNRQLSEQIAEVPDLKYPVETFFVHRHRHGQPSEPHVRTVISLKPFSNAFMVADVPTEFFEKLPRTTLKVTKKARQRRAKLSVVAG